jgi:hypothetical protein
MERTAHRTYSVGDFSKWNSQSELVLAPKFQRRDIWSPKARSYLIDTIIRGFPIPIIFIRQKMNIQQRSEIREVVDGQQRIRAVLDFLTDKFTVSKSHNKELADRVFSDLDEVTQTAILEYEFSVVVLPGASDADVLEVFSRLNTYQERLNRQELLNAKYAGAFKITVFELGREHLEFWTRNGILSHRRILRMGEAELAGELVIAMLDGLQDKKKSLKDFYEKFDDEFPDSDRTKARFHATIEAVSAILGPLLPFIVFRRRVLFYSLFLAFYDVLFGLPKSPTNPEGRTFELPESVWPGIRTRFEAANDALSAPEPTKEWREFWDASRRQTDNVEPRRIRHKYLWNLIVEGLG